MQFRILEIIGIIKAIVRCWKIGQEPGRYTDMIKAMVEMTLSRDMSSNEHETQRTQRRNTSQVSGSEFHSPGAE